MGDELSANEYGGVEVQGLKELGAALRALPDRVAKNVARGAVAATAAVIRDEAKSRAPVYTGQVSKGHPPAGTLKRAIITKQIPEKSGPLKQTYYVHVRTGKKYAKQGKKGNLSQDAFYWWMVEFGTAKMSAKPFMRPAFDAKKVAAVAAFERYLKTRLPLEVEKLKVFGLSVK